MKIKLKNHLNLFYFALIIGIVAFITAVSSHAKSNLSAPHGDTEFAAVESVDKGSITTEEGRFTISDATKIYDEHGTNMSYKDIKVSWMVRIRFERADGELAALDIVVRTTQIKILPE
jgi:hypothetical protein